jgi:hypothetical protein
LVLADTQTPAEAALGDVDQRPQRCGEYHRRAQQRLEHPGPDRDAVGGLEADGGGREGVDERAVPQDVIEAPESIEARRLGLACDRAHQTRVWCAELEKGWQRQAKIECG